MIRAPLLALLLALAAPPAAAQDRVVIGFRADAPPFSAVPPGGSSFEGFLVDLCMGALGESGMEIESRLVTASDRFDLLDLTPEEGGVDMLCDPMSISEERARQYLISPQVFATGVGFLRRGGPPPGDAARLRVGYLKGTTAETAVGIARRNAIFDLRDDVELEIDGEIDSHFDGVSAVCAGRLWFYFGDLDILKALRARAEAEGQDCSAVQTSADVYSYEAYALPVDPRRTDVMLALQTGVFRLFSTGRAYDVYDIHFGRQPRSPILQAVFSLNGVFPPPALAPQVPAPDVPDG